jgi:hypothetical protein
MANTKVCRACKQNKPIEDFGVVVANPDGRRYACKGCYNKVRADYRKRNPEKVNAGKMQNYYDRHEESKARLRARYPKVRAWRLIHHYGLTIEQYEEILRLQGGGCAICGQPPGEAKFQRMHVDHDHVSGDVRGILCGKCNVGLGSFCDSQKILLRAAKYLKRKGSYDAKKTKSDGGLF